MKGILSLLRLHWRSRPPEQDSDSSDAGFFSSAFAGQDADPARLVPWEARAVEVGAAHLSSQRGAKLLQALWAKDKYMAQLQADAMQRLERFFTFASVQADRDVIRQDEYGNFMLVVLTGTIAVDRTQPWGEQLRLAETRPGDILGEMSLLDSGFRFSSCITLSDCEIAVLSADAMDEMMAHDPAMAASLVALLARKLSQRLRIVSARLSDGQP